MKVFCREKVSVVIDGKVYHLNPGLITIVNPNHAEMMIKQGLVERLNPAPAEPKPEVVSKKTKTTPKKTEEPKTEAKPKAKAPVAKPKAKAPVAKPKAKAPVKKDSASSASFGLKVIVEDVPKKTEEPKTEAKPKAKAPVKKTKPVAKK